MTDEEKKVEEQNADEWIQKQVDAIELHRKELTDTIYKMLRYEVFRYAILEDVKKRFAQVREYNEASRILNEKRDAIADFYDF